MNNFLRALRDDLGWSQRQMGDALELSEVRVRQLEKQTDLPEAVARRATEIARKYDKGHHVPTEQTADAAKAFLDLASRFHKIATPPIRQVFTTAMQDVVAQKKRKR